MKQETLEITADSLEEARSQSKARITAGLFLLSERIVADGKPVAICGKGETVDAARDAARANVPRDARVEYEKEVQPFVSKTIRLAADSEGAARERAQSQAGPTFIIWTAKLAVPGKKGFLGIGKKQNQYDLELHQLAEVEIKYKPIAKISLTIADAICDGCYVPCGSCGRPSKVRMFDPGKVALIGPDQMRSMQRENVALKCQDCGYVVCFSCASSKTGPVGIPTCPSCKKEGGPYFFTTAG